ncbi:MAG: hypothetical protein ABIJ44_09025 [Pseudomonadota bacterium]
MEEKVSSLLGEIEKTCNLILEDRRLNENQFIAVKLGLKKILTLCGWARQELRVNP